MTNVVNPALAQPHGLKHKADPQGQSKLDRPVFGQTLQAIRTSAAVQSDPRWLAQARLTITIGNADRPVLKQPPEILPPLEPEEIDEPGEKLVERDDEPEANAVTFFPLIQATAFHHPAFTVRRVGDNPDAVPDLTKKTHKGDAGPQPVVADAEATTETPAKTSPSADLVTPHEPIADALDSAPETSTPRPATAGDQPETKPKLAAPESAETKTATPRAAIVIEQSTTALAPASTGVDLAEKLAAQATLILAPAKPEIAAPVASPAPVQAHSLKLQLHPAELGVVTASLRFAGEQLTIELQVETAEAHQRLSADSEAIVKTLRGLGYEIDRVTILQPVIAPPPPPRSDSDLSLAGQSRPDPQASDAGGSNNGGDRLERGNSGQSENETPRDSQRNAGNPEDRIGGSLYI